jgi:hypothetical protein
LKFRGFIKDIIGKSLRERSINCILYKRGKEHFGGTFFIILTLGGYLLRAKVYSWCLLRNPLMYIPLHP